MDATDEINVFFARMMQAQAAIETIADDSFQRSLLLSLLDILARCAFPNAKTNRDRFVMTIDSYSTWQTKERYGLLQLRHRIANIRDPLNYSTLPDLERDIQARIIRWPAHSTLVFPDDVDPTRQELQPYFSDDLEKLLESVRYPGLLWTIRNYAVHELRHPGGGMDFELGRPEPYYHGLKWDETGKYTWELFFPIAFIAKLVADCATNLKRHCLMTMTTPWNSFPLRPDWYAGT